MKSLEQICKSSLTHSVCEVSILADIDDQIEAYDNSIKDRIEKWIKENYNCTGLKISKKPNKDGLYEVRCSGTIIVKNKNITSLTNGMFVWSKAKNFYCSHCKNLNSLEGAPKKVEKNFDCSYCPKLESLEGAPQEVRGFFDCNTCTSLESLEGAPPAIGGYFNCSYCTSLKSLKGAPKEVIVLYFDCYGCTSLESLKGAPPAVGGDFYCHGCKKQFTIEDVRKVSDVKEKIYV